MISYKCKICGFCAWHLELGTKAHAVKTGRWVKIPGWHKTFGAVRADVKSCPGKMAPTWELKRRLLQGKKE